MGVFPSGQRGQTVNLLSSTSVVRIHPLPPNINRHTAWYGGLYLVGVAPIRPPAPGAVWSNPRSVKKMCLRHIFSAGLAAMPQGGRHHRQGHRYGGLYLVGVAPIRPPAPGAVWSNPRSVKKMCLRHIFSAGLAAIPQGGRHHRQGHRYGGLHLVGAVPIRPPAPQGGVVESPQR